MKSTYPCFAWVAAVLSAACGSSGGAASSAGGTSGGATTSQGSGGSSSASASGSGGGAGGAVTASASGPGGAGAGGAGGAGGGVPIACPIGDEPCADCINAMSCESQADACAADGGCGAAVLDLIACACQAQQANNAQALTKCESDFDNEGPLAAALAACIASSCATVCGW